VFTYSCTDVQVNHIQESPFQHPFNLPFLEEVLFFPSIFTMGSKMKAALLLRTSQASLVIGGLLLILIGSGMDTEWIRLLTFATIVGGIVGLIGEELQRRRDSGDDIAGFLLPAAGVMSGVFVLIANG
jgi:hypothetical protein